MAILKSLYQGSNFSPNSPLYEFTITLDTDITSANINTILPNNGTRYKTVSDIGYLNTGSSATIYTPVAMIVASFIAENGTINANTNYQEGAWKILSRVEYK